MRARGTNGPKYEYADFGVACVCLWVDIQSLMLFSSAAFSLCMLLGKILQIKRAEKERRQRKNQVQDGVEYIDFDGEGFADFSPFFCESGTSFK